MPEINGRKEIKEAVFIAVLVAVGQNVVTGVAEEVKRIIQERRNRKLAKQSADTPEAEG